MVNKKTGETLFFKISVFLLFLICLIPICFAAGIVIPIPYGALMTFTTLFYIIISWRYENIFSKKYISKISAGTTISVFVILAIVFILSIILLDSYRDFAFKIAIMLISITCACIAAVYGGAIKNESLLVEPPNIFLQVFTVLLKRIPFKIFITIATFVFSAIVWIILSYGSYYSGVEVGASQAANIAFNKISEVINSNIENSNKKKEIDDFLHKANTKAQIIVNKNNEVFTESYPESAVRPGYELSGDLLQKEPGSKDEKKLLEKLKDKDHNQYTVTYRFPNKPFLIGGLGRAVFFSAFSTDNEVYFKRALYLRSMHLWWVFWLLYALSLYGYYLYQGKEEALMVRDKALEDAHIANLKQKEALSNLNNFRLTYDKIRSDFAARTSDSKNNLQIVNSTYDKQAWDVQEKAAAKLGRHDVFGAFQRFRKWKKGQFEEAVAKNKQVSLNSYRDNVKQYFELLQSVSEEYGEDLIADTYDITLSPWLKVMQNELRELEHVLDITPETKTVKQVVEAMVPGKAIPKNLAENRLEGKSFRKTVSVSENVQNSGKCDNLVLSKLQSIIFNLIENSARAVDEHFEKLDFEEKFSYEGIIELRISETIHKFEKNNATCKALCFEVQDNAGGFPESILNDIYKRAVPSNRVAGRDYGEGTVYIGFFVDLMKGDIEAQNVESDSIGKGALTKVYIPYYEDANEKNIGFEEKPESTAINCDQAFKEKGNTEKANNSTLLFGALIGDIAGSRFEWNPIKTKDFELFADDCMPTDDSVMTLAVADAILACGDDYTNLEQMTVQSMQRLGRKYPNAGYGGIFYDWLLLEDPKPYYSFGNGAAMRVSPCGFAAKTLEEAIALSKAVTKVTHNHPEGMKAAEAVAVAIFLAKTGKSMAEIRKHITDNYYRIEFTLDDIRPSYKFDVTCQGSVPQAFEAFFESKGFEDAIRNAISLGGDSDTIAAITGSMAEAFYGIPVGFREQALMFLDDTMIEIVKKFEAKYDNMKS